MFITLNELFKIDSFDFSPIQNKTSGNYHCIKHIGISLGTKFHLW